MADLFEFRDFIYDGENVIDALLNEWGDAVRAEFDDLLRYLAITPMGEWTRPQTDKLHGKNYRELREFRVKKKNIRYRLYGFDGPGRGQITLVAGWRKVGGASKERSAHNLALRRMGLVRSSTVRTVDHAY